MLSGGTPFRASPAVLRRLGILLSAASLAALMAALANTDLGELVRPLAMAQWEWLGAALVLALTVEVAKTVRWQLLLGVDLARLPQLLALVFSARLLNAFMPFRAGDVWRIAFVARVERRHLVMAGGSVAAEKLIDGAALGG